MANFVFPRPMEAPQWSLSHNHLDFGRVRPQTPVSLGLLVSNLGGGDKPLELGFRSVAPWLQMREGENAPWQNEVDVRLSPGEEKLLLVRADPTQGQHGGQNGQIEVENRGALILNAPRDAQNASKNELPPLNCRAYFLEQRFLSAADVQLSEKNRILPSENAPTEIVRSPQTREIESAQTLELRSMGVPLGDNLRLSCILVRSDGIPSRVRLDDFRVVEGKRQWVHLEIEECNEGQRLHLEFWTANRQPGVEQIFELEVQDSDELVAPLRLIWRIKPAKPACLQVEDVQTQALARRSTPLTLPIHNTGESPLHIYSVRVPQEFGAWLSLQPNQSWPVEIAPGQSQPILLFTRANHVAPGQILRGCIEVNCNHMGRSVLRRVPVVATVPLHALRVEIEDHELQVTLDHNTQARVQLPVHNDGNAPVTVRLAVNTKTPRQTPTDLPESWLSWQRERLIIQPGESIRLTLDFSATALENAPKNGIKFQNEIGLVVLESESPTLKETVVWHRPISLSIRPRAKRFKLF